MGAEFRCPGPLNTPHTQRQIAASVGRANKQADERVFLCSVSLSWLQPVQGLGWGLQEVLLALDRGVFCPLTSIPPVIISLRYLGSFLSRPPPFLMRSLCKELSEGSLTETSSLTIGKSIA